MALTLDQQKQIENLGKQWLATTDPVLRQQLHDQAQAIRNSAGLQAGVDYDTNTGAALKTGIYQGNSWYNQGLSPAPQVQTQPMGTAPTNTNTASVKPASITGTYKSTLSGKPDAQFIIDTIKAMQTNSGNWASADDAGKAALNQANRALGQAIGAQFDEGSGQWTLNGVPINGPAQMSPEYFAQMLGGTDYINPTNTLTSQQAADQGNPSAQLFQAFMAAMGANAQQQQAFMNLLNQQAQQQAQAIAEQKQQALRDLIENLKSQQQSALMGITNSLQDAQAGVEDKAFQNWLAARQAMANRGLAGSGIASDQDTRLLLAKQRDLAGIFRDAARQEFDVESRIGQALEQAYRSLSNINSDEIASGIFQNLYKEGRSQLLDQAKVYSDLLSKILPYDFATIKDQMDFQNDQEQNKIDWAKINLDEAKAIGLIRQGDMLVPTLERTAQQIKAEQDWAKITGLVPVKDANGNIIGYRPTEESRHNQANEANDQANTQLRGQELVARVNQWAEENKLAAGRLNLSAAEFQHKMDYDQATLDRLSAELALDKDKAQLDALKSQLAGIDSQIRTYVAQGAEVPQELADARNAIVGQIGSIFAQAPKKSGTAGVTNDLFKSWANLSGGSGSGGSNSLGSANDGVNPQFKTWIYQGSRTAGVRPDVIYNMMLAESGGNPNAVSPAGAIGLMQFMPDTAAGYGIDPRDPQQAITGAIRFMMDLLNQFGGDYEKAVAAYNWGPGNVERAIQKYGSNWKDALPGETKAYLKKVLGK